MAVYNNAPAVMSLLVRRPRARRPNHVLLGGDVVALDLAGLGWPDQKGKALQGAAVLCLGGAMEDGICRRHCVAPGREAATTEQEQPSLVADLGHLSGR